MELPLEPDGVVNVDAPVRRVPQQKAAVARQRDPGWRAHFAGPLSASTDIPDELPLRVILPHDWHLAIERKDGPVTPECDVRNVAQHVLLGTIGDANTDFLHERCDAGVQRSLRQLDDGVRALGDLRARQVRKAAKYDEECDRSRDHRNLRARAALDWSRKQPTAFPVSALWPATFRRASVP
jgi:hypothetical protein